MRIGEVSELSGVSVRMLRHYDRTGLLSPSHRTSADYRDYSPGDLERLFRIESLRSLGLTLAEVRDALDDPTMDAAGVLDRLRRDTRTRIRAEQELLARLDEVSGAGPADWEDALRITSMLTALRDGTARQRQAAALSSPGSPPMAALLDAYLTEPDTNAAGTLRWALVRAGEDAVTALTARAAQATRAARSTRNTRSTRADGNPDDPATVRRRLVEALVGIDDDRATTALEGFLDDLPGVSAPAAVALARRGVRSPALLTVLVGMIVDGTDDTGAADALAGLVAGPVAGPTTGQQVPPATVTAALLTAAEDAPAPARLRIVQALGDLPGTGPALDRLTGDPDPTVARTARHLRDR